MTHSHGNVGANTGRKKAMRRLSIALVLTTIYMLAEIIGGLLTNSLALLADAGHMFSDALALALSLFAFWIARRPPSSTRTYGYYRTEILAALANGATLIAISVFIFIEAYERFDNPPAVQGPLMVAIASGGLVMNLVGLWILNSGKSENLNVRGAWLHVFTDALGSVGVIVSGLLIWTLGWNRADPIASVVIGLLVIYSSWSLLKETVSVLMEGTPGHIDVDRVRDSLVGMDDVVSVHDLHVWSITSGIECLSAHLVARKDCDQQALLSGTREHMRERFGIAHVTIQIEFDDLGVDASCPVNCAHEVPGTS